jgi:hypothetical protein
MHIARIAAALLMLAALGTAAHAPSERTRDQVKAGLAEVVRNEDVLGADGAERGDLMANASDRADTASTASRPHSQEISCSKASHA